MNIIKSWIKQQKMSASPSIPGLTCQKSRRQPQWPMWYGKDTFQGIDSPLRTPSRWFRSRDKLGELFSPKTTHVVEIEIQEFLYHSKHQYSQRGWGKLWNLSGMLLQGLKGHCNQHMIILPQALEATRAALGMLIRSVAKLSHLQWLRICLPI